MPEPKRDRAKLNIVQRLTLNDRIYEELKRELMTGNFPPGAVITLRGLSDEVGTSIQPVRDAVRRLAAQHALELLPNRIIRVPRVDEARFQEVWRLRQLLEGEASALAARSITAAQLATARRHFETLASRLEQGDTAGAAESNQAMYFAIYEAARSPQLIQMIEGLWLQAGPFYASDADRPQEPGVAMLAGHFDSHLGLFQALEARDPERARAARQQILTDYAQVFRRFLGLAPTGPEDDASPPKRAKRLGKARQSKLQPAPGDIKP